MPCDEHSAELGEGEGRVVEAVMKLLWEGVAGPIGIVWGVVGGSWFIILSSMEGDLGESVGWSFIARERMMPCSSGSNPG